MLADLLHAWLRYSGGTRYNVGHMGTETIVRTQNWRFAMENAIPVCLNPVGFHEFSKILEPFYAQYRSTPRCAHHVHTIYRKFMVGGQRS